MEAGGRVGVVGTDDGVGSVGVLGIGSVVSDGATGAGTGAGSTTGAG